MAHARMNIDVELASPGSGEALDHLDLHFGIVHSEDGEFCVASVAIIAEEMLFPTELMELCILQGKGFGLGERVARQ